MHAVGDVADRHRLPPPCRDSRPVHIARETSPCSAETALARARKLQAQHRHAELFVPDCRDSRDPAPSARRARCPSCVAQRSEVLFDQIGVEAVVTGRHRRVRGEDDLARRRAARASSKPTPSSSMRARMASSTAKALCPSFRCSTPGVMPIAFSARKPPTPSSSSWRMRTRRVAAVEPRRSARDLRAHCPRRSSRAAADRSGRPSPARPWRG